MKKRKLWIVLNIVLFVILVFVVLYAVAVTEPTIDKPVLYLYPDSDVKVSVNFEHPEYIKTSYPKYDNGWEVDVKTNGDIYYNGRYYYALYWDEISQNKVDFDTVFYVEANVKSCYSY